LTILEQLCYFLDTFLLDLNWRAKMELEKNVRSTEGVEFFAESNKQSPKSRTEDADTDCSSPDLPPEFCQYRDEGCELADSCLNCPFSKCIYDEPGGKQHWLKGRRAKEIARLHNAEGKKIKELALMFGVSERTVQRALKAAQGSTSENCHAGGSKTTEASQGRVGENPP
jgi:hypothetical protein